MNDEQRKRLKQHQQTIADIASDINLMVFHELSDDAHAVIADNLVDVAGELFNACESLDDLTADGE